MLTLFLSIIAVFMFVITIGALIYLFWGKLAGSEEPDDAPMLILYGNQYSEGHAIGVLMDMEIGEERIKIAVSPRDLNYKKIERTKKMPEFQTIFYNKKQVEVLSDLSTHRIIIACYPDDISELPEAFKKTQLGKSIMNIISENNKMSDESKLMEERMNNLQKIAALDFGGKVVTNAMESAQALIVDKREMMKSEEKKPFDSSKRP